MKMIYYLSFFLLSVLNTSCNENKKQVKTEVPDVSEVQHKEKGKDDDSKHEIDLMTIKGKHEYNKVTYYFKLDTLKSRINLYKDFYGLYTLQHCVYVRPDSSLIYKPFTEDKRTLIVKNGLIREQRFSERPMKKMYKYDRNNHLVKIVRQFDYDSEKKQKDERTEMLLKWQRDRLKTVVESLFTVDDVVTYRIATNCKDCDRSHNPELFEYMEVFCSGSQYLLNFLLQEIGLCGVIPIGESIEITITSVKDNDKPQVYNIISSFDETSKISKSLLPENKNSYQYYRNKENMKKVFNWAKKAEKQAIVFPEPDFEDLKKKGVDVKF